jgi:hypothetical protein
MGAQHGSHRAIPPFPSDVCPRPEHLVGLGFRGWISGYQTGDIGCWEGVWRIYTDALGANGARIVMAATRRRLMVGASETCPFRRDECLAISMIAACQHETCPAMRACAFALIDSSLVDEVLHCTESYATTMRCLDQIVSPGWIVNANALIGPDAGAVRH